MTRTGHPYRTPDKPADAAPIEDAELPETGELAALKRRLRALSQEWTRVVSCDTREATRLGADARAARSR